MACFSSYAVRQRVEQGRPYGCLERFLTYRFRGMSSGSCAQGFESAHLVLASGSMIQVL